MIQSLTVLIRHGRERDDVVLTIGRHNLASVAIGKVFSLRLGAGKVKITERIENPFPLITWLIDLSNVVDMVADFVRKGAEKLRLPYGFGRAAPFILSLTVVIT